MLAQRPVWLPGRTAPSTRVYTLWAGVASFGIPLFVALVLATPGWSARRRARALAWGLAALTLVQVATLPVNNEFWQQMPARNPDGRLEYLAGHSAMGLSIFTPLFYYFEIMRGFFSLLVYFALLAMPGASPRPTPAPAAVRARGRCPCGSGRRYKRCCGAALRGVAG